MNTYHIAVMIPGVTLFQVCTQDGIVVATCDTEKKAKLLIKVLEHAENGNPGNDLVLNWKGYLE